MPAPAVLTGAGLFRRLEALRIIEVFFTRFEAAFLADVFFFAPFFNARGEGFAAAFRLRAAGVIAGAGCGLYFLKTRRFLAFAATLTFFFAATVLTGAGTRDTGTRRRDF